MRLSVVIPCYNHRRFVAACLDSVCGQDWEDLEVIVLDDGSTDGSWAAIQSYRPPSGVRLVRDSRPNRGASRVLNDGLRRATGDVLAICNSDDLFLPGRLRRLAGALAASPTSQLAFSRVRSIDEAGRDISALWPYARALTGMQDRFLTAAVPGFSLLLSNAAISTGNLIFTRALLERVGGFRPYKLVHDWDFLLRSLLETEPLFVDEPLYAYRLHASNSFTGLLDSVAARECPELMRRFLKAASARPPANERCPSPAHWPGYWEAFIEEHHYETYLTGWEGVDGPYHPLQEPA